MTFELSGVTFHRLCVFLKWFVPGQGNVRSTTHPDHGLSFKDKTSAPVLMLTDQNNRNSRYKTTSQQ